MNPRNVTLLPLALIALLSASCAKPSPSRQYLGPVDVPSMTAAIGILASNDDARIAGTDGEAEAARYLEKKFRESGLSAYLEEFPISSYIDRGARITLLTPIPKIVRALPLIYSGSTPGIRGRLVAVGLGKSDDVSAKNLEGAIAFARRGEIFMRQKAQNALTAGAIACIIYDGEREELMGTLSSPFPMPVLSIPGSEGKKIDAALESGNRVEAELFCDTETKPGISRNLVALKPSASGRQTLVIGAHLDSVNTPGALDNASGLACLAEIAKIASSLELPFDVAFAAFGAEEIGIRGSAVFLERWKGKEILGMINLDTVGSGDHFMVYTLNGSRNELSATAAAQAEKRGFSFRLGASGASDHLPFAGAGIPAVFLMREPEDRYHSDKDAPDAVSGTALRDTVILVLDSILVLAEKHSR